EIVNFHRIAGLPVLLAFSAGTAGEQNELRGDAELVACLMACLRRMYGQSIPEPVGHLVTRWNQDPFSLGSYSYLPVGSKQSLRRQQGVPPRAVLLRAPRVQAELAPSDRDARREPGLLCGRSHLAVLSLHGPRRLP